MTELEELEDAAWNELEARQLEARLRTPFQGVRVSYGIMGAGGLGGTNAERNEVVCPHRDLTLQEAVEVSVDTFGGCWQSFYEKLQKQGIRLVRT